ncbi:unnamed protein product [Victoria cruziana]
MGYSVRCYSLLLLPACYQGREWFLSDRSMATLRPPACVPDTKYTGNSTDQPISGRNLQKTETSEFLSKSSHSSLNLTIFQSCETSKP